jgi:hypothetical protein
MDGWMELGFDDAWMTISGNSGGWMDLDECMDGLEFITIGLSPSFKFHDTL